MLAPHIEDEPNNTTRFWVLGRQHVPAVGSRRDVARDVGAEPPGRGAPAARAVREARRVDDALESRPARTGLWEYLFFVDLAGHRDDPRGRRGARRAPTKAPFLKLLGSYPAAAAGPNRRRRPG